MITKQQVEGLIERIYYIISPSTDRMIIPSNIMLMDVEDYLCCRNMIGNENYLTQMWIGCGGKLSLQEIVSESGYIREAHANVCTTGHYASLKSKEASALFEFLLHLFPENNDNK